MLVWRQGSCQCQISRAFVGARSVRARDVMWRRVVLFSLRCALESRANCIFFRDANSNGAGRFYHSHLLLPSNYVFGLVANSIYGQIWLLPMIRAFPVFGFFLPTKFWVAVILHEMEIKILKWCTFDCEIDIRSENASFMPI